MYMSTYTMYVHLITEFRAFSFRFHARHANELEKNLPRPVSTLNTA